MKGYYHNITKNKLNIWIPDVEFLEDIYYEEGDLIYRSESGDATLYPVYKEELNFPSQTEEWAEEYLKNHPIPKEELDKAFKWNLLFGMEKWHIDEEGNVKAIHPLTDEENL